MKNKYDTIVVGAGLAGMAAAYHLAKKQKVLIIEKEKFLGGRTASWNDEGMEIESGFHRHIGYYQELPKLLKEVGVKLDDIIMWEKEIEIKLDQNNQIVLGIDPMRAPGTFLKDILGNQDHLTIQDKANLMKLFTLGFIDYKINPEKLDNVSIHDYAKNKVTPNILEYAVTPLSTGIFFLPKENYSAKLFFGLFYPAIFHLPKLRVGAYKAGMSQALIEPIQNQFLKLGGTIMTNTEVTELLYHEGKVKGVKLQNGQEILASKVILATDIGNAQKILSKLNHPFRTKINSIETTSALTVQLELKKPAMPKDRATFSPFTILISFTEESRSTFKNTKGRLSIIIGNPDQYISLSNEEIFKKVLEANKELKIVKEEDIIDYRVVKHQDKFYHLGPHHDETRPINQTPIPGLILAGDYTKQKMYATMEGAVISGIKAAYLAND